jgi:hypothetical protein
LTTVSPLVGLDEPPKNAYTVGSEHVLPRGCARVLPRGCAPGGLTQRVGDAKVSPRGSDVSTFQLNLSRI